MTNYVPENDLTLRTTLDLQPVDFGGTSVSAELYQSEFELEKELISQLGRQGWKRVIVDDDKKLEENFRAQLNKLNRRVLDGNPLSDTEFRRILASIKNRGVFESAMLLRDEQLLLRDDNTEIRYSLFNTKEWCRNIFQVTNQVKTSGDKWDTRYDVTLLINGLPLVQIELKRRGTEMSKAFSQICRYQQDKSYGGLFNFIQFFITSNGVNTEYFANSEKQFNSAFSFEWTDENNSRYTNLADFALDFMGKCWIAKMISRYMVVQETNRQLLIMRPYQVYGVEKMVSKALDTGNSGFIWHTTGSGKTLTSFKVARLLSDMGKFKKVFFLVDRRDLNRQTVEEFNHFKKGSVSNNENTRQLADRIASAHVDDRLVLTTIQKLDKALKGSFYAKTMDSLRDEPVVFIIDECHRTQFGEMQRLIRSHFRKSQYFGFTGTPRLAENKSQDGRTTADVFDECLHTYLLKDGIRDKNVLPFSVEYVGTISAKETISNPEIEAPNIMTKEVLHGSQRVKMITKDIIKDRIGKSRSGKFNAMFTVDSVHLAGTYMDSFKEVMADLPDDEKLVTATVYSYDANESLDMGQEHARSILERFITDYNERFGTNYSTSEAGKYTENVADRFKKGGIDLLIVVDMMLTGFDSPIMNTLYVDRGFEHHTLIQAYSRTNRVYGAEKGVGHIRCYRNLKEETDDAIKLFSNVSNANEVLALPYEDQTEAYLDALEKLRSVVKTPEEAGRIESEIQEADFVFAFRAFNRELRKIETFTDFKYQDFPITRQEVEDFRSHYLDLRDKVVKGEGEISILNDIDFCIEEIMVDTINVDYIFRLMGDIDPTDTGAVKKLRDMVSRDGTTKLHTKQELLLDFIDNIMPILPANSNVQYQYLDYVDKRVVKEVQSASREFGLTSDTMFRILRDFRYSGKMDMAVFNDETDLSFMQMGKARKKLKEFVSTMIEKLEVAE